MISKRYSLLGWLVWRVAKWELIRNRSKLVAVTTIVLVVIAGFVLAAKDEDG
ncbi:MAG TPA: hypothetical protein VEX36_00140 [Thermoleophilaceae bacterium]|nr:hypothetical protein [Thermoleophilaceae bacterium]